MKGRSTSGEAFMQSRLLGHSGTVVSNLALGTMTFGTETDESGSHTQLSRFLDAGGNLVDTANVYSAGASEDIIGSWLAAHPGHRSRIVLASKGRFPMADGVNDRGLSRRHLRIALDASLRRLRTDWIDLYQVHSHDPLTPIEETLRFLDDAVTAGKINYVGLSNFTGWQLQQAVSGGQANGLGLLPWSPLGGGWLTGKYRKDERPTGDTRLGDDPERGVEAYDRRSSRQRTWDVIDAVRLVASDLEVSMAQVALAWLSARPAVTSVILGARTTEQLEDNLLAADLLLSPDQTSVLDAASDPEPADYPYGVPGVDQRDRKLTGRQ